MSDKNTRRGGSTGFIGRLSSVLAVEAARFAEGENRVSSRMESRAFPFPPPFGGAGRREGSASCRSSLVYHGTRAVEFVTRATLRRRPSRIPMNPNPLLKGPKNKNGRQMPGGIHLPGWVGLLRERRRTGLRVESLTPWQSDVSAGIHCCTIPYHARRNGVNSNCRLAAAHP
jgi:hypothetical protein